jgi:hypothetical protein
LSDQLSRLVVISQRDALTETLWLLRNPAYVQYLDQRT